MSDYWERLSDSWNKDRGRVFSPWGRRGWSSRPVPSLRGAVRASMRGTFPIVRFSVEDSRRLLGGEYSEYPIVHGRAFTWGGAVRKAERAAAKVLG